MLDSRFSNSGIHYSVIPSFRHSVIPSFHHHSIIIPSFQVLVRPTAINLTFTFRLKNRPNVCKHALCYPHQLFGTILGRFGRESVQFENIISTSLTFESVNFRSSSHTESDPCHQVLLHIFLDRTLNFNFPWTASEYTFPLFDNSLLKMFKTCYPETPSEVGQTYDLLF